MTAIDVAFGDTPFVAVIVMEWILVPVRRRVTAPPSVHPALRYLKDSPPTSRTARPPRGQPPVDRTKQTPAWNGSGVDSLYGVAHVETLVRRFRSPRLRFPAMIILVVGTDGSDLAIQAAAAGVSLVGSADHIKLVAVADTVDPSLADDATGHAGSTMTHSEVEEQHRDARSQGHSAVAATKAALETQRISAMERVETFVIDGDPGPALCRFAEEVNATAVVVGSRGRGGIRRAVLGSVSDYVVRNAPCSVVVTRSAS
jgi:nucleotide-binding universal stress UspA family protein